jgi:uncharacterized protein (DUF1810 family)
MLIITKETERCTYEVREGAKGNGRTIWIVYAFRDASHPEGAKNLGAYNCDSLSEAKNYLEYCCL